MTRYDMMERISAALTADEIITVSVSHKGNWSGADLYTIRAGGEIECTGHAWNTRGTLRSTYAARVLNK